MSVACFTCSGTTDTVSPMTNTCYWNILRSLLLPDHNIEHVCFPNPDIHICTICKAMLCTISEFRDAAVNSVRTQLEHWNREIDPMSNVMCTLKAENDILDIKEEIISEDSNHDKMSEQASLHDELMLDTADEVAWQVKTEPELLMVTDDNQDSLDSSCLDNGTHSDGDGAEYEDIAETLKCELVSEEAIDPSMTRSKAEASTSAYRTRKRTIDPDETRQPVTSRRKRSKCFTKLKDSYITKTLTNKELQAYREELRASKEFRSARHKCGTCLVIFDSQRSRSDHTSIYHSKIFGRNNTKCVVCDQTMPVKHLTKHIAAHFQVTECGACGRRSEDSACLLRHRCEPAAPYR